MDYDKMIEELKKKAAKELLGFVSDMTVDGSYLVIINVVKLCEDEGDQ